MDGVMFLQEYYRVLIYSDLLTSENGMSYINEFKDRPDLVGEQDIADLLNGKSPWVICTVVMNLNILTQRVHINFPLSQASVHFKKEQI